MVRIAALGFVLECGKPILRRNRHDFAERHVFSNCAVFLKPCS